jgi:type III secretion system YscD/HrpQ family protein
MKPTSTDRAEERQPLSLRVVRGLHSGAQRGCALADMIVVGSADDCDLILADAGVAAHHCVIKVDGSRWIVRALDGAVHVDTRTAATGDSIDLQWFEVIGVGSAALALGEPDSDRWDSLIEPSGAKSGMAAALTMRKRVLVATLGVSICLATAIAASSLHSTQRPQAPSQRAMLESSVRDVALEKAEIGQDDTGKLRVSGLADDHPRIERLRGDLAARGVVAELDVRSGKDIARDVGEVLRLSNLQADTEYRGAGEVGISGHFGDGKRLDGVLASRAIRDVKGLAKVAVVNLDNGQAKLPVVASGDEARRIVVAVGGTDPYIVTGDGSRYFAGAQLPCGGRLHSVEGQEVFVDTGTVVRALDCTGSVVQTAVATAPAAEETLSEAAEPRTPEEKTDQPTPSPNG